jgi:hypothetical protein
MYQFWTSCAPPGDLPLLAWPHDGGVLGLHDVRYRQAALTIQSATSSPCRRPAFWPSGRVGAARPGDGGTADTCRVLFGSADQLEWASIRARLRLFREVRVSGVVDAQHRHPALSCSQRRGPRQTNDRLRVRSFMSRASFWDCERRLSRGPGCDIPRDSVHNVPAAAACVRQPRLSRDSP